MLIAARSHDAFEALRGQLTRGEMDKRYLALVHGVVTLGAEGVDPLIELAIAKHPTDPRRVHVCLDLFDRRLPAARAALTEILSATPAGDNTLLELRATVAVRHQIRAHLAALGHPLVGDWLYGGEPDGIGRHFLHASEVRFAHPSTGEPVRVTSALPPELAALV